MYGNNEQDVYTEWVEGVVYHSIKDFDSNTSLELRPVLVHRFLNRNKADAGTTLFMKVNMSDSYNHKMDTYEGKLALWLDYYRLYELHKFLEKYVDDVKAGKAFTKVDGVIGLVEPKYELTHISDKTKFIKISPIVNQNGPSFIIEMTIGTKKGIFEGNLVCTTTELIVLSSATGTLLNQFGSIAESLMNRNMIRKTGEFKSDIQTVNQNIQRLERMIANGSIQGSAHAGRPAATAQKVKEKSFKRKEDLEQN